jgi:HEAT repeat protein
LQIPAGQQLEQTLADVADSRVPRSRAALQYLARLRPDPASRAKVSRALNAPLLDVSPGVCEAALNAVRVWGSKANTATLLKLLTAAEVGRPDHFIPILEILSDLQDPAAAPALAQGLTHPRERELVSRALQAIGSGAEEAVIPFLQSEDDGARCVACQILAEIGTGKSLKALKEASLANPTAFGFNREALIAIQKIMARS